MTEQLKILVRDIPLKQKRFVLEETESSLETVFIWEFGRDPKKVERGIYNFNLRRIKSQKQQK